MKFYVIMFNGIKDLAERKQDGKRIKVLFHPPSIADRQFYAEQHSVNLHFCILQNFDAAHTWVEVYEGHKIES